MPSTRASAEAETAIIAKSCSHVLIKRPGVAESSLNTSRGTGIRDARQLPYTRFPRCNAGRPEGTSDIGKANHSRVDQLPRAIIHKTGWNNRRSRNEDKSLTVGCTCTALS